jgi:hypothetical protein
MGKFLVVFGFDSRDEKVNAVGAFVLPILAKPVRRYALSDCVNCFPVMCAYSHICAKHLKHIHILSATFAPEGM